MTRRGRYIVLEGHDGTGKSLQARQLRKRLKDAGIPVADFVVEEPDGATTDHNQQLVPIASELRKIIKNGELPRDPWTNVALFSTARRANWHQAIQPALQAGLTVVTARSYISTIAYQGYGDGVPLEDIERRTREDVGEAYMVPDLELILAVSSHATRRTRIASRGALEKPDTFESREHDFQERVRLGYENYAQQRNVPLIDTSGAPDEVEELIWRHVEPLLKR